MLWTILVLVLVHTCSPHALGSDPRLPRSLGSFHLPHAAFVEVMQNEADGLNSVYITTFNPALPFFHDDVYYIADAGNKLDNVNGWSDESVKLTGYAFWPNFPVRLPSSVVGFEGVVVTSGFLVPGKSRGKLELHDTSSGTFGTPPDPWDISYYGSEDQQWSYHWVEFRDVDNDGREDIMTARFYVPSFGGDPVREFIWFKNPGTPRPDNHLWNWESHVLINGGPDVTFQTKVMNINGVEYSVLVCGELWSERVMLYYVENTPGAWADPTKIYSFVLDNEPGQPFEARFADLDNDGVLEVVASAYDTRKGNETGNFWVYQQPEGVEWNASPWKRTAIASGFIANAYLFGNSMTPGHSQEFWPSTQAKEEGKKPWIALSGDDDGIHYILFPKTEEKGNMEYDLRVLVDTGETTAGTMDVVDLDNDGFMEIIAAGYTKQEVYVFSFKQN